MKGRIFAALMVASGTLAGCATNGDPQRYCELDATQKPQVIENVRAVADSLSGPHNRYLVPELLLDEGLLYRDSGGCWSYLILSSSDPDRTELQGIAGVYVDLDTLQAGDVFWFRY